MPDADPSPTQIKHLLGTMVRASVHSAAAAAALAAGVVGAVFALPCGRTLYGQTGFVGTAVGGLR